MERMSFNILHAHTGASYTTNPKTYASLDDLRTWIVGKTGVQAAHQILMTARGKQVKLQTLATDSEVFLYDRSILASTTSASKILPASKSLSTLTAVEDPPKSPPKVDTLDGIQAIIKKRRDWALQVSDSARSGLAEILQYGREINVVLRGTTIAVENIRQHITNLKPKYEETKSWADQICEEQASICDRWRSSYDKLADIPVEDEFSTCIIGGIEALKRSKARSTSNGMTLQDYVTEFDLEGVNNMAGTIAHRFRTRAADLQMNYHSVVDEAKDFIDEYYQTTGLADNVDTEPSSRLFEEIELLSKKMGSDYQHILGLSPDPKAFAQALKVSQLHKANFIPSILQTAGEIAQVADQLHRQKQDVIRSSIQFLQQLSLLESRVSLVHSKLAKLDVEPDAADVFDLLNFVIRLPSIYGRCLIEYVRRREWIEEMQSTPASKQRDAAMRKEEEIRRRTSWKKDTDGMLEFTDLGNLGLDDASGRTTPDREKSFATREDVYRYLEYLRPVDRFKDVLQELDEAAKVFVPASRQHSRMPVAFKKGSLHEASQGRNAITLPADNQGLQDLQIEKLKVDEKLRSAESRIRKLEDLLHRQSQLPRPPSSGGFNPGNAPTFERHVTSPVPNFTSALSKARDLGSRRSSTSSRRVSQNMDPEEKSLAHRIVSLEAELIAQKAESKDLKQNAAARLNAEENLKSQAREAIATKEDLLSNMEAQQHEFDNERRLLEEENSKLNLRLEELEDEFDRVLNNDEHEGKLHALQDEVDRARQEIQEIEEARNDELESHRDKISILEQTIHGQNVRNDELATTIDRFRHQFDDQKNAQTYQHQSLKTTYQHVANDENAPDSFSALVDALEVVAFKAMAHQREIEAALRSLQAEHAGLEQRLEAQDQESFGLRRQLGSSEREMNSLRDVSTSLQTRLDSAVTELDDLQSELKSMKAHSENLERQIIEEVNAHQDISKKFTSLQGYHGDLDDQLREKIEDLTGLQQKHDDSRAFYQVQAVRAQELSRRLQMQIESLRKLLELVGYMITKQEGSMVIQKIPKSISAASTTLNDPSMSMRRSLSGTLPTRAELEALIDSDALHWATTEDPEQAAMRYEEFVKTASDFDIDAFDEAIYKRVKDIEHIARKWQREAKAYRDKAHRAQSDAHERIALRSFKEGDLALFLPTRDQATKPWAAFNVGAPHYFLREQDSHKLGKRDWLIARISKVEERVVDLSKSMNGLKASGDRRSAASAVPLNDENPYELSDGLRWYLLDAAEEKPGAPISIGTGKATVAMAKEEEPIKASIGIKKASDRNEATKTLARSLDSRRSSTNSRKSLVANATSAPAGLEAMLKRRDSNGSRYTGERASLEVPDSLRPETPRIQEIHQGESSARPDQVGIISAPDW